MKLKVCGMKYQDNIADVAALQPDYMGFIFYEQSTRFVQKDTPEVSKKIKKTGVFVDASLTYIVEQINAHKLRAVQLHGSETPKFCQELKLMCHSTLPARPAGGDAESIEIIKVFSVKDEFDFSALAPYEPVCDYYLFDTKGEFPGGNGVTFNWNVLTAYPSTKPYFLSGGISLEETEQVLSFLRRQESRYCYAIDVNSGFEIAAGLKNIEELKRFKEYVIMRS